MRIIFHECKKAFISPVLIGLILLFMVFNIYLIFSHSYFKEELTVANAIARDYGTKITPESLEEFKQDQQKNLVQLHQITGKHTEQEFSSINEFLDSLPPSDYDMYSEAEWAIFNQLNVRELYLNMAENIDSEYAQLDWEKIAEDRVEMYGLSGKAAGTLKEEYEKLSNRFEEVQEKEEHSEWFFIGQQYKMHSFLFRTVFRDLIFESLILIVLATALLTNYEFENRTQLITYSTKRGRNLMKDKFAASLLTTTVITALLMGMTLLTYFSVFDYSNLWGSSISSAFNWEYDLPYVSWWDLSFLTFLLWSILLVYVCMLLFTIIAFVIASFVKNSYFTFFLFAIFFGITFIIPDYMPLSSNGLFISLFTPVSLVVNPHLFFMGSIGLTMFKNYELMTVSVWTVIMIALLIFGLKRFNKLEIH
ncbi:hypothetical protein ACS127_00075 [Amphibacillus sp. Q70]|uniref:hypothetical protein n=1 Tax=Amphibacillus sp. Q70 TaxID=3453416 RepID=UPI003F87C608